MWIKCAANQHQVFRESSNASFGISRSFLARASPRIFEWLPQPAAANWTGSARGLEDLPL